MKKATDTEPDDLLTQMDAATLRGVELSAVNQWVRRGRVGKYIRFGRTLVSRAEILAYDPEANKGGRPKSRPDDETANRAAKKKAISRWENEGGAVPKGKKKGSKQ
jgi:hypothetical protein